MTNDLSFRTSSVSNSRTKRSPIDRSLYTPRFPRAFAIPLRDGDEKEEQDTTSAPQGESNTTERSVPDFSSELYRFTTQTCNQFAKQTLCRIFCHCVLLNFALTF